MSIVAYCHRRRAVRLFALDNIRSLSSTGRHFIKPADFSLAVFLEGSLGMLRGEPTEIVVHFDVSIARWAKRTRWGFPHSLQHETDGSLVLRGKVSGLDGIRTELLRWGAPVTVLEPPELRKALLREAQALVQKYQQPDHLAHAVATPVKQTHRKTAKPVTRSHPSAPRQRRPVTKDV